MISEFHGDEATNSSFSHSFEEKATEPESCFRADPLKIFNAFFTYSFSSSSTTMAAAYYAAVMFVLLFYHSSGLLLFIFKPFLPRNTIAPHSVCAFWYEMRLFNPPYRDQAFCPGLPFIYVFPVLL